MASKANVPSPQLPPPPEKLMIEEINLKDHVEYAMQIYSNGQFNAVAMAFTCFSSGVAFALVMIVIARLLRNGDKV